MNLTTLLYSDKVLIREFDNMRLWSDIDHNIGIVYTEEVIHDNGVKELVAMFLSDSLYIPITTVVNNTRVVVPNDAGVYSISEVLK